MLLIHLSDSTLFFLFILLYIEFKKNPFRKMKRFFPWKCVSTFQQSIFHEWIRMYVCSVHVIERNNVHT